MVVHFYSISASYESTMANDSRPSHSAEPPMNAELDLLHSILDPRPTYPWNPYTPDSEAYLAELEASWDETGTVDAIAAGWQMLSAQLDTLWPTAPIERAAALATALAQQFTTLPDQMLNTLADQALALANTGRPLIDQLVQSVQAVLMGWDKEDLEALARPLAYSLRDGRSEILDLHIRALQQSDWAALSEVEKARLSLAVASVALNQAAELGKSSL
ncbi:MAG: hypothetical protein ICV62_08610 [Cyanobacteria bacterium Co-bin13]|nr:hypothetical protein [Cyanobacteria bacterium Co-bin13]